MKKYLLFLLLILPFACYAQVNFKFQQDGTYRTDEGKDYIIVKYDSLKAKDLFLMVKNNINRLYKSPKDVLSEVDYTAISIRGYSDAIFYIPTTSPETDCGGYYNLNFEFKDGRIKVHAPVIDDKVAYYSSILNRYEYIYVSDYASKLFKMKNGKPAYKRSQMCLDMMETKINALINDIISKKSTDMSGDDW